MKILSFIIGIIISALTFSGCGSLATQSQGLSDQGYLLFVSSSNQAYRVDVTIDDQIQFKGDVIKSNKSDRKGNTYAIGTGKKHIVIKRNGEVLYDRTVLISTQETKKIILR